MKLMRFKKLIVGVAVLAAPAFAMAQSAEQLIQKYTPLAGNNANNAEALVNGLRDGTKVTMSSLLPVSTAICRPAPPPVGIVSIIPVGPIVPIGFKVEFSPPTSKMGNGNVDNALTLAQGSLANLGIVTGTADPSSQRAATTEDVCVALVGGDVRPLGGAPITLPGILKLRSEGWGWGEISKHPLVGAKL